MPAPILILYVVLVIRMVVNLVLMVNNLSGASTPEKVTTGLAMLEFGASLLMFVALIERKRWVIAFARIYFGVIIPLSLYGMFITCLVHARNDVPMAWNPLIGGVIASVGIAILAVKIGSASSRKYFPPVEERRAPPLLEEQVASNQSTDPTLSSGTPAAGQPARHP